jgi:hypothetical protein
MPSRRNLLKGLGAGATALLLPRRLLATEPSAKKLNFVFILIDDMGWRDLACYGSTFYETPNIDRLAGRGALGPAKPAGKQKKAAMTQDAEGIWLCLE